jgi:hypothetical protein
MGMGFNLKERWIKRFTIVNRSGPKGQEIHPERKQKMDRQWKQGLPDCLRKTNRS